MTHPPGENGSRKRRTWLRGHRVALAVIFAACAGLRLWALDHDLPHSYYPDEIHFVKRSVAFGSGDLNPHWFHKPALFMYVLFFEYGLLYLWQSLTGMVRSVDEFALRFLDDPTPFFLLGRLTSAAFGLGGVFVAYRIGRLLEGRWVGVGAAAALTATYAHNVSSKEVKADLACTFFTLLAFLFILRVMREGRWKYVVLAGATAGLGMATKYYSLFLFVPMMLAVFLDAVRAPAGAGVVRFVGRAAGRYGRFLAMVALFFLFFFLGSPFNYLDPQWYELNLRPMVQNRFGMLGEARVLVKMFHLLFGADFSRGSLAVTAGVLVGLGALFVVAALVGRSATRVVPARAFGWMLLLAFVALGGVLWIVAPHFDEHLTGFVRALASRHSLGLSLAALAFLGVGFFAVRMRGADLLVLSAALSFSIIASFYLHQAAEPRHLHPLYPLVLVAGVSAFARLGPRWIAGPDGSVATGRVVATLAFIGLLAPGLYAVVQWNRIHWREDTRTLALAWFEENIPSGAKVLVDKECVRLSPDEATIQRKIDQLDVEIRASRERRHSTFEQGVEPFLVHKGRLYVLLMTIARERRNRDQPTYDLRILDHPWWAERERADGNYYSDVDRDLGDPLAERTPEPLDRYREQGVEFIVTESGRYRQILDEDWAEKWPSYTRFYRELGELDPVFEVPAQPGYRPGPTVRVYDLTP